MKESSTEFWRRPADTGRGRRITKAGSQEGQAAPELSEAEGKWKTERIRRQSKRKKKSRDRGEEGSNPAGRYCERCVCSSVDASGCRTKERGGKCMKELKPMIHDEKNGLDYILVGDYYIPLIRVAEETRDIGFYGSLRRNYLKDYKQALYSQLMLTGKLWTYLADFNEICAERRDSMMAQIMEAEGVTEDLKGRDQMEWLRRVNNIRNRVDEVILTELVYV